MKNAQDKKGDGQSMTKESVFKKVQEKKDKEDKVITSNEAETIEVIFLKDAFLHWSGKSYKQNDEAKIAKSDFDKLIKTNHVKIKEL